MSYDFYHLKEDPFAETPDPDFLFFAPSHKAALHALMRGCDAAGGCLALLGATGLGKTTLLQALQTRLRQQSMQTIPVPYPKLSGGELLDLLCQECGIESPANEPTAMYALLRRRLAEGQQHGWRVVLVLDEAHHVPLQTFACLAQLLDGCPSTGEPLLRVVLAGLPGLQRTLTLPALRPLAKRLAVRVTLAPLSSSDSLAYIRHRLTKVFMPEEALFPPQVLQLIVRAARGNPRVLNTLCANMLITGALRREKPVSLAVAQEVLGDLGLTSKRSRRHWGGAAAAILLAGGLWWGWTWSRSPRVAVLEEPPLPASPAPAISPQPAPILEQTAPVGPPVPALPAVPTPPVLPRLPATPVVKDRPPASASATPAARQSAPPARVSAQPLPAVAKQNTQAAATQSRAAAPVDPPALSRRHLRALDRAQLQAPDVAVPLPHSSPEVPRPETAALATPLPVAPPPEQAPPSSVASATRSDPSDNAPVPSTPGAVAAPQVQTVYLHSLPDDATIIINGKTQGRTPLNVQLPAGAHRVRVEKPGYASIQYVLRIDQAGERHLYHDLFMNW
jgi:type II secretory pathway predicted ATPase ExeA